LQSRLSEDSILNRYLGQLKNLKSEYAVGALSTPKAKDAFEYGKHCGIVEGLNRAELLLSKVLGEEYDE
jgi:hypothetical protein